MSGARGTFKSGWSIVHACDPFVPNCDGAALS
jgi:hypothetical protein